MSIIGPILTVNSERITSVLYRGRTRRAAVPAVDDAASEAIALMEGAIAGAQPPGAEDVEEEDDGPLLDREVPVSVGAANGDAENGDADDHADDHDDDEFHLDPTIQQAMEQSDQQSSRKRDPEY